MWNEIDGKKYVLYIVNKKNVMKFRFILSNYSFVGYKCDRKENILLVRF